MRHTCSNVKCLLHRPTGPKASFWPSVKLAEMRTILSFSKSKSRTNEQCALKNLVFRRLTCMAIQITLFHNRTYLVLKNFSCCGVEKLFKQYHGSLKLCLLVIAIWRRRFCTLDFHAGTM